MYLIHDNRSNDCEHSFFCSASTHGTSILNIVFIVYIVLQEFMLWDLVDDFYLVWSISIIFYVVKFSNGYVM